MTNVDNHEGKHYAYEITQKLTYYIVTAELVFSGYLLLNADKLIHFKAAPCLFAISGMAALLGLLWRFFYNITYHAHSHREQSIKNGHFESRTYKLASYLQHRVHNLFALASAIALIWGIVSGYQYIHDYKTLVPKEDATVKTEEVGVQSTTGKAKMVPNADSKPNPHPIKKK